MFNSPFIFAIRFFSVFDKIVPVVNLAVKLWKLSDHRAFFRSQHTIKISLLYLTVFNALETYLDPNTTPNYYKCIAGPLTQTLEHKLKKVCRRNIFIIQQISNYPPFSSKYYAMCSGLTLFTETCVFILLPVLIIFKLSHINSHMYRIKVPQESFLPSTLPFNKKLLKRTIRFLKLFFRDAPFSLVR